MQNELIFWRALPILFACWASTPVLAQLEATSPTYSFNIQKHFQPPILRLVPNSLGFIDEDGNGALDAGESCAIQFSVTNSGMGEGFDLRALNSISGSVAGISVAPVQQLPIAPIHSTTPFTIPLTADLSTVDGEIEVTIEIEEPNGFGMDAIQVDIETRGFRAPHLEVIDHQLRGEGTLRRKTPFAIEVEVQNVGQGEAKDVRITLVTPQDVFVLSENRETTIDVMASGESVVLLFDCIINNNFAEESVAFDLNITEGNGKFGSTWQRAFQFNDDLSSSDRLDVEADQESATDTNAVRVSSGVDQDIPKWGAPLQHRYAVVIGNEDYASRSASLNPEVNVAFAEHDARVVADYLKGVFGVPEENLHLVMNATSAEMRREVNWLANLARAEAGNAEIFFYYSGHGLPNGADRTPFLVPVDVDGQQPELGLSLPDLYSQLTAHPVRRVHAILDACFSGGARNEELVAMKGIRVVPREGAIPEGLLVWASSSGNQASGVYREKSHGHFTYQLLKTLQEASEDDTLGDLFSKIQSQVDITTARAGFTQTPEALCSPADSSSWPEWTIR